MANLIGMVRAGANKSSEQNQLLERRLRVASKSLWPWDIAWLVPLVALLAAADLLSTYILLELSGKSGVYESGVLASWALRRGGFNGLYIMNAVAVGLLCAIAATARLLYGRSGLSGFARTAYVVVLVPYAAASMAAVANNLLLALI